MHFSSLTETHPVSNQSFIDYKQLVQYCPPEQTHTTVVTMHLSCVDREHTFKQPLRRKNTFKQPLRSKNTFKQPLRRIKMTAYTDRRRPTNHWRHKLFKRFGFAHQDDERGTGQSGEWEGVIGSLTRRLLQSGTASLKTHSLSDVSRTDYAEVHPLKQSLVFHFEGNSSFS